MIMKESPLQQMNLGKITTVAIRELPLLHTIDLRVAPSTQSFVAVTEALGINLPEKTGQFLMGPIPSKGETLALCLAPDWWLILGDEEAEHTLDKLRLNDEFHFSFVDVSGQRTTIELEGPNAQDVLAHLWDQDLREKSFPVGSVSQGLMAKAPVIICHIAPHRYYIIVRSSFALHLWSALSDAAVEWV